MLISFDIGTKNLALCVLDGRVIKLWHVLDLVTQQAPSCATDGCTRRVKFSQNDNVYCKTCAKSKPEFHTLLEFTRGNVRSKKLAELRDVLNIHNIDPPRIKQQCVARCQQLIEEMKLLPLVERKAQKPKLPAIGLRLMTELDACLAAWRYHSLTNNVCRDRKPSRTYRQHYEGGSRYGHTILHHERHHGCRICLSGE